MDSPNGGLLGHLFRGEWTALYAMMVAAKPSWISYRIFEAVLIALITSAATTTAGYILVVIRLDERVNNMQSDINYIKSSGNEREQRTEGKIKGIEDRARARDDILLKELTAIREQIGRLDGRTDRGSVYQRGRQ